MTAAQIFAIIIFVGMFIMIVLDKIERHSIFTIYTYPIKGFDMFLRGLRWIVQHYPDTHVYVAGNCCKYRRYRGIKKKIMDLAPDYDWYVQGLIEEYNLKKNITFLGFLNEAMISGVPSVASCVGGLQEMIDHGKDGFLYPFNETYMMAEYVCQIFGNDEMARTVSQNGHDHASRTYDKEQNCKDLLNMYETITNAVKERKE